MTVSNYKKTPLSAEITDNSSRLVSMADGVAKAIAIIDFDGVNSPFDVLLYIETKLNATGVDETTGAIEFYLALKLDTEDYMGGIDPTANVDVAAKASAMIPLSPEPANSDALEIDAYRYIASVIEEFPDKAALIALNNSGATLSSTGGDHSFSAEQFEVENA